MEIDTVKTHSNTVDPETAARVREHFRGRKAESPAPKHEELQLPMQRRRPQSRPGDASRIRGKRPNAPARTPRGKRAGQAAQRPSIQLGGRMGSPRGGAARPSVKPQVGASGRVRPPIRTGGAPPMKPPSVPVRTPPVAPPSIPVQTSSAAPPSVPVRPVRVATVHSSPDGSSCPDGSRRTAD